MSMKTFLRFCGMLLLCSACGLAQQGLPNAPAPDAAAQPQQAQPTPQQTPNAGQKSAPPQFEDLSPRKKTAPPPQPTSNSKAEPEEAQQQKPAQNDPVGSPDAAPQQPQSASQPSKGASSNAGDESEKPEHVFRAEAQEVDVVFTVTDKHGRFVRNLTQNDFTILDNKKPPKSISSFSAQTDLPLRVGLLIDASSSIRERFRFEQEAASEFLASIVRPKVDKAFVLGFDSNSEVTQDFTNDTGMLAKGVRMLRPGGGTAMYDAIYQACRHKLLETGDREPVRKAIIIVSDGDDNQSLVTREEAVEMAQRAEVIIYAISTNNSNEYGKGDKVLGEIASATGGRAFYPLRLQDVSNAFADVQEELRSQYSLAYVPADIRRDGSFHTIDIDVKNSKLKARARKGYYALARAQTAGNGGAK